MLTFLKLGGSLITDKSATETALTDVINRLAAEVRTALDANPALRLVLGHGSGSFGHTAAATYGTRRGVSTPEEWRGFAEVSVVAARLNTIVLEAFHATGVPVFRVQPSASAVCRGGQIIRMELAPVEQALQHGLVPLVYGDVAVDEVQGGTIVSTEDVFDALARALSPARILLAGQYEGVLDAQGNLVPRITPATLSEYHDALGGSAQTDVTGGMAAKVESMLALCQTVPGLKVVIFDGRQPGVIARALSGEGIPHSTLLEAG